MIEIPHYEIKRELGRGGMSTVYLAVQKNLNREVALKVMAPALVADQGFRQRFFKEGQTIARLSHPNIITVHDIAASDTYIYMALEYAQSGNLSTRIRRGITIADTLKVLKQIGSALAYAHLQGIVHRDVKSANIIFRQDGTPLLTDFGVAKSVLSEGTQLTQAGVAVGTPRYMSPEQALSKPVTAQSDLYSLGIILHEMLTGRCPFETAEGNTPFSIFFKHINDPIPILPKPLAEFQPLIDKLLAKEPEDRFASAAELIAAAAELESRFLENREALYNSQNHRILAEHTPGGTADTPLQTRKLEARTPEARTPEARTPAQSPAAPEPENTSSGLITVAPEKVAAAVKPAAVKPALAKQTTASVRPADPVAEQQITDLPDDQQAVLKTKVAVVVEPAHRRWPLWVALVALLTAGAGGWAYWRHATRLPAVAVRDVNSFFEQKLHTLNAATTTYRELLALQPDNDQIRPGLQALADAYARLVEAHLNDLSPQRSLTIIDQGLKLLPDHPPLLALRDTLPLEQAGDDDIQRWLARADELFQTGQFLLPVGDNAAALYRRVLRYRPDQPLASERLDTMAGFFLRQAEDALAAGEADAVADNIEQGLMVYPQHPGLLALKQKLTGADG